MSKTKAIKRTNKQARQDHEEEKKSKHNQGHKKGLASKKELRPQKGWVDEQELMPQKGLVLQTKGSKKTNTWPRYVGM